MKLLRKIFFPLVPVYYLVSGLRNKLYDWKVIQSKSYPLPIICVGNLSVGGTGKSPMIEYLIRLFKSSYKVATLSRGYKRNTSGFVLASKNTTFKEIGDEPFQFMQKFEDILVAVDESRQHGIETLLSLDNSPELILLDDAFQHRKVNAGLNILLTTYDNLYIHDWVLPTGNLREPKSGAKRADLVIVTKCPALSETEKNKISENLNLNTNQKLFFSSIAYDDFIYSSQKKITLEHLKRSAFTLVTGIANSDPLLNYLKSKELYFEHLNFEDHYNFTQKDLDDFKSKALILTTEKDFGRLKGKIDSDKLFYLPISIKIDREDLFNKLVGQFVANF